MGKRSAVATTDEEVAKLTLSELNGQIGLLKWRAGRTDVLASLNSENRYEASHVRFGQTRPSDSSRARSVHPLIADLR
jgi:hypothetical protein